jgi:hypothetical protein
MSADDEKLKTYVARWAYIKADIDGARALLLLLKNGKGTADDFDTMVDRIIESRKGAGLG